MENATAFHLKTSREFNVDREELYRAWTSEEALRAWWHPMGNRLSSLEQDIREGGRVRYRFETAEGKEAFTISGDYIEVVPGEKLVYSWDWHLPVPTVHDTSFILNVSFEGSGPGSRISIRQEQFSSDEAIQPHRHGWEEALDSLGSYLEGRKS